ncbi:DUF2637 domain-containing protein [Mangrovihabitans endophyticus]|uniref:DUF2637 domain-containing protein n=1 Tax=Mangrovihabitans endophyticus TaxID=1751298 RepID=A0A8J3FR49_9ACTN|nr:DUF2637 domain-containing protein [Mangrovihabitans endophyticus]GGL12844.1 hypothetical protein GCM10012284_54390 [Mangrovihabitans endophyticus]
MLRPPAATAPGNSPTTPGTAGVERAAWTFYLIAALGSSIGQIWVGTDLPPWPDTLPLWTRALLVAPFALVIDLGGAVASAFADTRRRLGETATGWRLLSAASVTLAVGINVAGHADSPYLATVFAGLGTFAYSVWLLHTAARRRDALRAAGKLRNTPPAYGILQWKHAPTLTWRARTLAVHHGYGLTESLTLARRQLATEKRQKALAAHIEARIRARHHHDPILASIAATTTPIEEITQHLIDLSDARTWALAINAEIQPPPLAGTPRITGRRPDPTQKGRDVGPITDEGYPPDERRDHAGRGNQSHDEPEHGFDMPTELARMLPRHPATCRRWQGWWAEISGRPEATNKQLATEFATSVRTVQRIRAVGAAGLLDSPSRSPHRRRPGSG